MREWERRRLNERGRQILQRGEGKAVRPQREDGYVNLLNKYGSQQDSSEAYRYEREPLIPDMQLTSLYEGNGLFAKIIDAPAEEALKHGFSLGLKNEALDAFVEDALDALEWEEKAAAAIKWARLYGGAIIVMLMDDGRGLEEPVDWKHIRSIDELRVYERAVVQPDYASLYRQDCGGRGAGNRASKFGRPEFYDVSSIYGAFRVHESRCLLFRNGVLPELTTNTNYRLWGMPEYIRIQRALRETLTAHGDSVRLLERSVQAIYSMKNLAQLLAAEDGENQVLKRLQVIDMARGLLNSIAIDAEGESYDFKVAQFSGVRDVIDASCNMLSALTNIPQTLLFGRSPAGMNATGEGDLENWYSFVERIQKLMLRPNLRSLLDVTFRAGVACGDIAGAPAYRLRFRPLWSLSETEQAAVAQTKAQTAQIQAQTAQIYVDMQAMDPQEVRHRLARDEAFDVEDVVAEDEGEDLLRALYGDDPPGLEDAGEQARPPGGGEQSGASQLQPQPTPAKADRQDEAAARGVGVLLLQNGRLLCGTRADDGSLCGPGGHIGAWETPEEAAIRETQEEFGVTPKELIPVATLTGMPAQYCDSVIYLCTEYDGAIACGGAEITGPGFLSPERALELMQNQPGRLFFPFALSIFRMIEALFPTENSPLTAGGKQGRVNDKGDFDESKHPRGEKGRFAPAGSGGASSEKSGQPQEKSGPSASSSSSSGSSAETKPKPPSTEAKPQQPSTEAKPQQPSTETKPQSPSTETKPQSPSTEAKPQPPSPEAKPKQPSTEAKPQLPPPSAEGENIPCTGFASRAKLKDHTKRHKRGVGADSEAEYQQKGIDFLKQPCGGDVLGYVTPEGKVVRFNKKTCEYATGMPGGRLRTYMSPKCDKKTGEARPDKAMRYYENHKKDDLKEDS